MFTIEYNIPIPDNATAYPSAAVKYPFASLEIGDSFCVPGKTKMASTIASAAGRTGHKYRSAVVTENDVTGTRIWRIEGATAIKQKAA